MKVIENLNKAKVILYPTDTIWGIGCDATNPEAVAKIYKIKQRAETKSLVVLVSSIEMLETIVKNIPPKALEIIQKSVQPTTIVYDEPVGIATNAIGQDNTVAIRIASDDFCKNLIESFGKPIVSTSANISGQPTPKQFTEIDSHILEAVDYIVDLHQERISKKSSTILKITKSNQVILIRE